MMVKGSLIMKLSVRTMSINWVWPKQVVTFRMEWYLQASKNKELLSPLELKGQREEMVIRT